MNLQEFDEMYVGIKGSDKITVKCDHPKHKPPDKPIGKTAARRNILKSGGIEFVCRVCMMQYDNPMNRVGQSRQTDEVIKVCCPDPQHVGDKYRDMKKSCYYGSMVEPYEQVCGSCVQRGKVISEAQKAAISKTLKGRKLTPEHRERILAFRKNNPEWAAQANRNLIVGAGSGWNKGQATPQDVKDKISEANKGKTRTTEQKENISRGRMAWFKRVGGFTKEHRQNISRATVEQYKNGFDPKLHHRRGWHDSTKGGKVFYRSSYEKRAFQILDDDVNVVSYESEVVQVYYWHPEKKIRSTYLVDIFVAYKDGSKLLVEVKPLKLVTNVINFAKGLAALKHAKRRGWDYRVWTEVDLFSDQKHITDFVSLL